MTRRSRNRVQRVVLDETTRQRLKRDARSTAAPHRLVLRSRIIVALDRLGTDVGVARHLNVSVRMVRRWRERFLAGGVDSLMRDAPGRGRKSSVSKETMAAVADYVNRLERGEPVPGLRALSGSVGLGLGSVHRLVSKVRAARGPVEALVLIRKE